MGVHSPSGSNYYRGVEGLGGWLALIQIYYYGSMVSLLLQLLIAYTARNGEAWELLAMETSEYFLPAWKQANTYEVWSSLFLIGFLLYVMYMFYGKKRLLPKIMLVYLPVVILVNLGDLILLFQLENALETAKLPATQDGQLLTVTLEKNPTIRAFIRSLATCAILIPYFLKSERVQNTFIK